MEIPPYDQLMLPLFKALKDLGVSASIAEIDEYVGEQSGLPSELPAGRNLNSKSLPPPG